LKRREAKLGKALEYKNHTANLLELKGNLFLFCIAKKMNQSIRKMFYSMFQFISEHNPLKAHERLDDLGTTPFLDNVSNIIDSPKPTHSTRPKIQTILKIVVLATLVVGVASFLGFLFGSEDIQDLTVYIMSKMEEYPTWLSSIIMASMFTLGLIFFCPMTPFNLAAGFLFGTALGSTIAIFGCMMGASIAFLLGRTIARGESVLDLRVFSL
jgi:hypothetical protein